MIFIHSISHLLIRRQTTILCMCTFNTCECVVNFTRDITDLCTLYINIIWKHSSAPLLLLYVYYTLRLLFGFFFILLVFCLHPQRISVCVCIYIINTIIRSSDAQVFEMIVLLFIMSIRVAQIELENKLIYIAQYLSTIYKFVFYFIYIFINDSFLLKKKWKKPKRNYSFVVFNYYIHKKKTGYNT